MSDWLEQLSELEQRATKGKWYVVGAPWGDGTIVIAGNPDPHVGEYICDTDDALVMDDEQAKEHGSCNSIADAEFIAALRNNASELISRARRADEAESRVEHLERENEQLRQRENEQRKQLNHIEAYCSDYVDDITTSHKMIRNICEVIGMEWERRV